MRRSASEAPVSTDAGRRADVRGRRGAGRLADVLAALVPVGLFAVAAVTGAVLRLSGRRVGAGAAPVFANWLPHLGLGTPAALAVAAAVVWQGPRLAATLRWRTLLAAGYATAVAWALGLALVDGWQRGLAGRLITRHEYLSEVAGVADVPAMLRGFTGRILDLQPDSWTTHVAGHPPGALLVFVALDRIGLGGGGWAALACVLAGASIALSVPATVRALRDEAAARAVVPFAVLFPGAVWIGASADGLFAGVTAAGVALMAVAARRPLVAVAARRGAGAAAGVAGGVLLGFGAYLSYGLVLMLPVVLVVTGRHLRGLLYVAIGAIAVAACFTAAGFWWLDGYHLVVQRYYQGIASDRPYGYWVWANLALIGACAGPAAGVIVRRAVATRQLLPLAALAAMLAADVSGLSKAEVERIWLPFTVWLVAGASLIPARDRRPWLAVQAATALLLNHLLLTTW